MRVLRQLQDVVGPDLSGNTRPAQVLDVLELLLLVAMSRRLFTCVVLAAPRCQLRKFQLSRDINARDRC